MVTVTFKVATITFKQPIRPLAYSTLCKCKYAEKAAMYHGDYTLLFCRCWLNPYTNFVWSFIVPVVVIIFVNFGFFIMALVIMYRHTMKRKQAGYFLHVINKVL